MSDTTTYIMWEQHHPGLLERLAVWLAWTLAGALFLTVGWIAMEPADPMGAITLVGGRGIGSTLFQVAAIGAVAAGLATFLAGRRLPDAGAFAAAFGLALVSLRAGTVEYLLAQNAEEHASGLGGLGLKFAVESLAWFLVILVALAVSALIAKWFFDEDCRIESPGTQNEHRRFHAMAWFDIPRIGVMRECSRTNMQTAPLDGFRHFAITIGAGFVAFNVFSTGLGSRSIQHGQSCFVVAAGVSMGCYAAHRLVPVRSALWSVLAIPAIAVGAYLWAGFRSSATSLPVGIPASPFLRILPIQYVSVGTAAAVAMFWHMAGTPPRDRSHRGRSDARTPGPGVG